MENIYRRSLPTLPLDPKTIKVIKQKAEKLWEEISKLNININMARGKPSPEQLELSSPMLEWNLICDFISDEKVDCRNYGEPAGISEMRILLANILNIEKNNVIATGNSSLEIMYQVLAALMIHGPDDSSPPWSSYEKISFICPVPGYDRHFKICEEMGINMISVPMRNNGPDIDIIEDLVSNDPSIKGIWCIPKYSNPTGVIYSSGVIKRLASLKSAAHDFRLFWDNAYVVHHLTNKEIEIDEIISICSSAGHPNRPYVFTSTSKITLPNSGIAAFASSESNIKWWLERSAIRTVGPDKMNQLRHARFLESHEKVKILMARHREILAPKFSTIIKIFKEELNQFSIANWSEPLGGYFISLDVPNGCAKRTVELAANLGIELTPAGTTFPYGKDPQDGNIRIAPSFLSTDEVSLAARGIVTAILMAVSEQMSI
ncbi:aminotransferase class I/II-fold pyridoxal phosphate-dependent enzyme [Xenorhabdus doucetiae]|uniref:DNA-binding transcriptional MocR family regulator n=1 Tax=Xenorhabdus doucetiae TaxID=351671 RepID=A0A068QY22_9GAMM|nr:aminotransferase class I/II-fold pyridoxal phosphate-dependent enzyme [Xenorhabdus doucetiae]TYO98875.1 DNA-binding transcriptional MocR family regulator [Xenorhabdus doucetiae]CDG19571.1 putative aminotransferase MSMEG_6286 [Xenorhabdus doucetiae]